MTKTLQLFVIATVIGAVIVGAILGIRHTMKDTSAVVVSVEDEYITKPMN